MHDALPLGGAAGGDRLAHRGEAADHGRAGPARAGVGGHADRLVDHHDVVVAVDHPQAGDRLGRSTGRPRPAAGSVTSSQEPALTLSDLAGAAPSTERVAGLDQGGGGRAGQPEQARRRPGRAACRPGRPAPAASRLVAATSALRSRSAVLGSGPWLRIRVPSRCRPVNSSRIASTTPQNSADVGDVEDREVPGRAAPKTLIKSTTWPWNGAGRPEHPVAQVAERPAEDQPERDRPRQRPQPAGHAQPIQPSTTSAMIGKTQVKSPPRLNAAPLLRVRSGRPAPPRSRTGSPSVRLVSASSLVDQVEPDDHEPPRPNAEHRPSRRGRRRRRRRCSRHRLGGVTTSSPGRAGGQRRSSSCLQVTQRVADGNAASRSTGIGVAAPLAPAVAALVEPVERPLHLGDPLQDVVGQRDLLLALERLGAGVGLVVAGRVGEPVALQLGDLRQRLVVLGPAARRGARTSAARIFSVSAAERVGRTGSALAAALAAALVRLRRCGLRGSLLASAAFAAVALVAAALVAVPCRWSPWSWPWSRRLWSWRGLRGRGLRGRRLVGVALVGVPWRSWPWRSRPWRRSPWSPVAFALAVRRAWRRPSRRRLGRGGLAWPALRAVALSAAAFVAAWSPSSAVVLRGALASTGAALVVALVAWRPVDLAGAALAAVSVALRRLGLARGLGRRRLVGLRRRLARRGLLGDRGGGGTAGGLRRADGPTPCPCARLVRTGRGLCWNGALRGLPHGTCPLGHGYPPHAKRARGGAPRTPRTARIRNLWSPDKHATPDRPDSPFDPYLYRRFVPVTRARPPRIPASDMVPTRHEPRYHNFPKLWQVGGALGSWHGCRPSSPNQRASRPRRLTARSRRSASVPDLGRGDDQQAVAGPQPGVRAGHEARRRRAAPGSPRRPPGSRSSSMCTPASCDPGGTSSCSRSAPHPLQRRASPPAARSASAGAVTPSQRAAGASVLPCTSVKTTTSTKTDVEEPRRAGHAERERDRGQHDRHRPAQPGPGQEGLLAPAEAGTRSR